ncbi:hypothetical protein GLOIN_2v1829827 [Rhizophagus irregularis DAOM 181602=DAOM 197198]|uniref:Uncharacterized protein n=1 Tax=Rhizophagus irregularis (strain DAOM 197198w) TaxID=1432141 RepID=A0A015I373_RHIIW|nr:hypothetical protein RirG_261910 [Rhizophagus irregularis DAOM 197198w]GBC24985.1 hypothetical protein GLOIN_2v1829827 [Rhizophagus irregularis DAOM 181602=DAOM 197198]
MFCRFSINRFQSLLLALSNDPNPYTIKYYYQKKEPVEEIAKIFPRDFPPPSEHVHILVEQPICGSSDEFQYEIRPRCEDDKIWITTACVYTTPETSVVIDSLNFFIIVK